MALGCTRQAGRCDWAVRWAGGRQSCGAAGTCRRSPFYLTQSSPIAPYYSTVQFTV